MYKGAVIDTLKQKRSYATAAGLHARAKARCEANQIAVYELLWTEAEDKEWITLLLSRFVRQVVMSVLLPSHKNSKGNCCFLVGTERSLNLETVLLV